MKSSLNLSGKYHLAVKNQIFAVENVEIGQL